MAASCPPDRARVGAVLSRVLVEAPRGANGPRIVTLIAGVDHVLTISEATDLHRALGEALLIAAKRFGQIDPRIVEDPGDERRFEVVR